MPACMQHRNVRTAIFLSDLEQRKLADGTSGHEVLHNTLTKNVLCPCGPDDDLCPHGSHTDLDAGVAVLSQLSGKELVKLGIEYAICDELQAGTKDLLSYSTMLRSGYRTTVLRELPSTKVGLLRRHGDTACIPSSSC